MSSHWPVHVPLGPANLIGDLVVEVPVGSLQGPIGHAVPEDLVGIEHSHNGLVHALARRQGTHGAFVTKTATP